jgi:hypothetical protein
MHRQTQQQELATEQCDTWTRYKPWQTTIYLLTYLDSWALLEKLPIVQLLKNFPAFYGTWRLSTVFTIAFHWFIIHYISIITITLTLSPHTAGSQDSAVGIVTDYGLDEWRFGVRILVGSRIFYSPHRPDRLQGPPNLLSNSSRGSFPGGKAARAWSWPLTFN